jgi:hypothetical protein
MPDIQLTNPTGNNGEGVWLTSQVIEEYLYDPNVTTSTTGYANGVGLVNGMCVFLYGGYTYSTGVTLSSTSTNVAVTFGTFGTPGSVPVIRKTSIASALFGICGVVVNAPAAASIANASTPTVTGGYQPGSIVQVCVQGIAGVLVDANAVTPGKFLVWGTTTPGCATYSATITAGETFGTPLAYQAAPTNNALVPAYINLQ